MPQASDKMRAKMAEYFPSYPSIAPQGSNPPIAVTESNEDGISDAPVYHFLAGLGLQEARGIWMVPPDFPVTSKVINCLNFMCDEWDYDWKWEGCVR